MNIYVYETLKSVGENIVDAGIADEFFIWLLENLHNEAKKHEVKKKGMN